MQRVAILRNSYGCNPPVRKQLQAAIRQQRRAPTTNMSAQMMVGINWMLDPSVTNRSSGKCS